MAPQVYEQIPLCRFPRDGPEVGAKIQSLWWNLCGGGGSRSRGHAVKSVGAGDCKPGLPSGDKQYKRAASIKGEASLDEKIIVIIKT